jgi:hypothetical protein
MNERELFKKLSKHLMTMCIEQEIEYTTHSHKIKGVISKCSVSKSESYPIITMEVKITEVYHNRVKRCPETNFALRDNRGLMIKEFVKVSKPERRYINNLNSNIRSRASYDVVWPSCKYFGIDGWRTKIGAVKWD